MTDTHLPYEDRDRPPVSAVRQRCGYELSNYEVVRHLALPVADELIQEWIDEAAAAPRRATRSRPTSARCPTTWSSPCACCSASSPSTRPTGAVDFEEEVVTPQRYAEMIATTDAMGRARYETIALTADRQVVAHSTLALPLQEDSTRVYQWGTFVHREHRGHRLGLATKAVNLRAVQAARDDLTLVTTQNGETNAYMVSINERLGFRPVEVSAEFVKRF